MEQMKPLGGNNERVWDVFFANTDLPTSVQKNKTKHLHRVAKMVHNRYIHSKLGLTQFCNRAVPKTKHNIDGTYEQRKHHYYYSALLCH